MGIDLTSPPDGYYLAVPCAEVAGNLVLGARKQMVYVEDGMIRAIGFEWAWQASDGEWCFISKLGPVEEGGSDANQG